MENALMDLLPLQILDHVPDHFFTLETKDLYQKFSAPTLFHLKGEKSPALFLSILLHGNEHSGFLAVKKYLKHTVKLPRDLIIFLGNTHAAASNQRHLKSTPDWNRIWSDDDSVYGKMAQEIVTFCRDKKIWASIDIHNNTGTNPLYACVNSLTPEFLDLASMFSQKIIYFKEPHQVQSMAFAQIAPAVTLECGHSGEQAGLDRLESYLQQVMLRDNFNQENISREYDVYQTIARFVMIEQCSVDFKFSSNSRFALSFISDIDLHNFSILRSGAILAYINLAQYHAGFLKVLNDNGDDLFDDYFEINNNLLICRCDIFPAMLTKNSAIAKEDCLGYFMLQMINF